MKDGIYTGQTYEVRGKRVVIAAMFVTPGTAEIDTLWYRVGEKAYKISGEKFMSMNPKMV